LSFHIIDSILFVLCPEDSEVTCSFSRQTATGLTA